jgi:hypothetical protein
MLIAYAALLVLLLEPLWFEMDIFIGGMTGVEIPWSVMLLLLAAASAIYCAVGYFLLMSGARSAPGIVRKVLAPLLCLLWGGILVELIQESTTSLPSVCPAWRLYAVFVALSAVLLAGFGIGLIRTKRSSGMRAAGAVAAGLCALLLIGFCTGVVTARAVERGRWPANTVQPHDDWSALWIAAVDRSWQRSPANTWLCYRKTFAVLKAPLRAPIRIAADTKYRLWVNGSLVISEGGLKRGPNPYDTYYDIVDIAPYVRSGDNVIAVLLWHFGRDGFSHADSGKAGLIVDGGAGGLDLDSDATWKARQHPAYYTPSGPSPNYRLAESNVGFDARRDPGNWTSPGYDDSSWEAAKEMGRPPCSPWGNLVERPIPQFRFGQMQEYTKTDTLQKGDRDIVRSLLPYNAQVTPYMRIRARAGERIEIKTDDYTGGGARNVRAEYITRDGVQEYETPGWMNGHVVLYSFPRGTEVLALGYRESGYAADFAGSFECDDPFCDLLWTKARRTLYLCMRDNYMDCPDRERAQWWNAGIDINQAFYCLDRASDLLARKAIYELIDWQHADGSLYSPIPSGNWDIELPMPMLASVGESGFWTYYMYTGDKNTLEHVYPGVMRYLDLWKTENGLAVGRNVGWNWGDWGNNIDMPVLTNAWYYLALRGALRISQTLEREADARSISIRMAAFEKRFDAAFWNGSAYRSRAYTGDTDDRANALAVVAGLVPPERFGAVRGILTSEFHASTFMEKYVLEALYMMGYDDDALERMKSRFIAMVDSPLTTLWEGWEIGSETYGGGTVNHAWSGGGLTLLSRYAAGVYPSLPGYDEFHVMPHEGSLSRITATVPSPKGMISVSIRKSDDSYSLGLVVPPLTSALVGLHSKNRLGAGVWRISANGGTVWQAGITSVHESVTPVGDDGRYFMLRVPAGTWSFEAEYR